MTIVVTVKVTDGIVLAADSAAAFFDQSGHPVKIYKNANKIFNLVKGWPIGALVYGAGGIGVASIETLSKDLRRRLRNPNDGEYGLDRDSYTVEEVAVKSRKFLFEENYLAAYPEPPAEFAMGYRICGYSAGSALPEAWEFAIVGPDCRLPYEIQSQTEFGVRWAGENETLDRLLLGASGQLTKALIAHGMSAQEATDFYLQFIQSTGDGLTLPAMPIQDAIDVAEFLVVTASKVARYGMRPETIGGPIELAAITKHEQFKWVARKHYYSAEFNRETDHD
jgi:hypothetical protein